MANVNIRRFVTIVALMLFPGFASADSCSCDSPCSGSVSCPGGCYAYCEENPENSGRHVCVKGCASEDAARPVKVDGNTALSSLIFFAPASPENDPDTGK